MGQTIFFIGDTHFGHENLIRNLRGMEPYQHDEMLVHQWNSVVRKKDDIVYHMGDVMMHKSPEELKILDKLNGIKYLVRGNHDVMNTACYLKYFREVYGIVKKYDFWLSHCPIHPSELRGRVNVHGHTHRTVIPDSHYLNVSCEMINYTPISLEKVRAIFEKKLKHED